MDWRHAALCRDEDPELFFPIGTAGPAATQVEAAKVVCQRCPVVEPCLSWALETGQDAGVWGATSEDERRALKRRAVRAGGDSAVRAGGDSAVRAGGDSAVRAGGDSAVRARVHTA